MGTYSLLHAVQRYYDADRKTRECTELLKSILRSKEAAQIMTEYYEAKDNMFREAGLENLDGDV